MSNPFMLPERVRGGALAEAADRLDRVVSIVKDQQLARTNSAARPRESEAFVLSPEEAWSRKYMIQCVGPVCTVRPTEEGALLLPRFTPPPAREAATVREIAPQRASNGRTTLRGGDRRGAADDHIGSVIGKPGRKRSWLGRIFRA